MIDPQDVEAEVSPSSFDAPPESTSTKKDHVEDRGIAAFFRGLNIGVKITFGFSFVLLILVGIVILSNINTMSFRTAFDQQMIQVHEAQNIFEVDRKVSDLQKYILIYSHTGQGGAFRRAELISEEVLQDLSAIYENYKTINIASLADGQRDFYDKKLHIISSMVDIIEKYPGKLKELSDERERSVNLVDRDLDRAAVGVENRINQIRRWEEKHPNEEVLKNIVLFYKDFIRQQRNIVEFFHSRKFSLIEDIEESFLKMNEALKIIDNSSTSLNGGDRFVGVTKNYKSYEEVFYKSMQASRGYLYLVNVVLAGETAEFLSLSSSLRILTLKNLVDNTDRSRKSIEHTQVIANISSLMAIFLGLLLALIISMSIARPIRRITDVVRRLAEGESYREVPGLGRGDEIGQIARAADVFKAMNAQTEGLLAQTERLAEDLGARERMLEKKTQELQKSNEDLDSFAYVASHDLKSPLRGIDNLACWIAEDCIDILPKISVEHLNTLRNRISRMESLLTDLLAYSRAGRVAQTVEMVDANVLAKEVFGFIDRPEDSALILLNELPEFKTQKVPLNQIFLNLLSNAIKYSDKPAPKIEVGVKSHNQDFYEFSVRDDGPGIDSIYHEKIFKMFQTLQARDVIEGSGMGLAIIKRVIENFGGSIDVVSSLGEGATFYFTWPKQM